MFNRTIVWFLGAGLLAGAVLAERTTREGIFELTMGPMFGASN